MSEFVQSEDQHVQANTSATQQVIVHQNAQFEQKAAGFWIRFWAYIVDILVLASVGMLLIKPIFRLFSLELNNPEWYAPFTIITAVIFYAYFVLMTKLCNQTVGKMIFGIRVISKDGGNLKWGTVIFREWIGRLISIIPLSIPYLVVAFTPKKQGVHDFIADTLVVHESVYDVKEKAIYESPTAKELHEPNVF
ncbi:RDD family protein [Psychrobacillus antarcticus]|uniref:RDD family protein n=1 Tax=Psychrobacillus antarcticus TaxID=2879115 RepID=UPI0024087796|nr:RDD family protein [Psychrobacillus antarcticus]